jgi:hypothetical protein
MWDNITILLTKLIMQHNDTNRRQFTSMSPRPMTVKHKSDEIEKRHVFEHTNTRS